MGSMETINFFEDQTQWPTEKDTKLFSEKIKHYTMYNGCLGFTYISLELTEIVALN